MSLSVFQKLFRSRQTNQIAHSWISTTRGVSKPSPFLSTFSNLFEVITPFFERTKVSQQISITLQAPHTAARISLQDAVCFSIQ